MTMSEENPLKPEHFRRNDESPDSLFYVEARLVTHIDDRAIAAVTAFYGEVLPSGGHVLDLCSSSVSHLPGELNYGSVTGLGMNQVELDANPVLTRRVVQDLRLEAKRSSQMYARIFRARSDTSEQAGTLALFDLTTSIREQGVPLIVTDPAGNPSYHANLPAADTVDGTARSTRVMAIRMMASRGA